MKRACTPLLVAVLILCSCESEQPARYIPGTEKKKEKYATPEAGTYLKPAAYSLLKKINQVLENPDYIPVPAEWMMDMLATHQKRVVDTLLSAENLEIPVRIYYPTKKSMNGNQPVILYFHGGGFILGSVEQYHIMVSKLARITGNIIVSVDYGLAPEHPFPAAIMEGYAVLVWIREHGSRIGADSKRICVMGDSAGGNIATVLTLLCRDNGQPQPMCQVLIYPGVTFVDTLLPSRIYFGLESDRDYVLSESFLRKVKVQYMGQETNDRNPYLSPLEAQLSSDLPPALIITAECDPIRDGARLYAQKLNAAGVDVTYIEYSGMIHAFMSFHMILSDALDAMKKIRDYLYIFTGTGN